MSTVVPLSEQLNPLQDAFNHFVLTMPRHKLDELVQYLDSSEGHQIRNQVEHARHGPVATGATASRSAARRRGRDRPLRPLNSFIAFRSYYSTMFPELTQKAKSGILRFLWQNDPFKAKWAILAKAYSKVRDEHSGSGRVCLETFLNLNAGYIGVLEPSLYLETMGWELTVDEDHQYTMARISHATANESDVSTNYSVNDIVNRCYETGYVPRSGRQMREGRNNEAVMSFVAQPRPTINERNNIQVSDANTVIENIGDADAATQSDDDEQMGDTPTPSFSDTSSVADESSPVPIETPDEQNNLQSTGDLGTDLDMEILGRNMTGSTDVLSLESSNFEFDSYNTDMIHPITLESFDFNQFVDF